MKFENSKVFIWKNDNFEIKTIFYQFGEFQAVFEINPVAAIIERSFCLIGFH